MTNVRGSSPAGPKGQQTAIDAEGVAIVAIQGLSQVVAELKTELQRKDATISNLEGELAEIKCAISLLANQKTTTAR